MSSNLPAVQSRNIFKKVFVKLQSLINKNKEINYVGNNKQVYREKNINNNDFKEKNKVNNNEINIEPRSLDYAIDQFLSSYYYSYLNTGVVNSYYSLTNLGAKSIEDGKQNKLIEENLLKVLTSQESKYKVTDQKNNDGNVCFYHVATNNYRVNEEAEPIRLYINCKRENVATLTTEIINEMKDKGIYLKFSSDYQLGHISRSESIVVYTDSDNAKECIEKIQQIHNEKNYLFDDSENTNPFMKNVDNYISYAPSPRNEVYIDKNGGKQHVAMSYNTFLSKALEESFVETSKSVISRDKDLTIKTSGIISDDPNFYIKYFEDMKEGHYRDFINSMKRNLREAQNRNDCLDIKGINEKGESNYER